VSWLVLPADAARIIRPKGEEWVDPGALPVLEEEDVRAALAYARRLVGMSDTNRLSSVRRFETAAEGIG